MTASDSILLCLAVAGVGVIIAAAEALAVTRVHADDGLLSWEVNRTAPGFPKSLVRFLDGGLSFPRLKYVLAARTAFVVAVWAAGLWFPGPMMGLMALGVVVLGVLLTIRSPYGQDGADQIFNLVFGAAAISAVVGTPAMAELTAGFLGIQGCLSYFFAGVAKAAGASWRTERALIGTFSTEIYGNQPVAKWLAARPGITAVLSRLGFLGEIGFSMVLVAPTPVAVAILASGLAFHVASAATMGLNTFLWAFPSLYPAVWWLREWILASI